MQERNTVNGEERTMKARDIMTAHPSVITPTDTVTRAAQMMLERNVGMLPVIENLVSRRLKGVLTDRDIVVRCVAAGHESGCLVRDHMTTRDLCWVVLDEPVNNAVIRMKQHRVRRLCVVSESGALVGVITLADLATRLKPGHVKTVTELERQEPVLAAFAH
jgi:CBS domain-containing protein